MKRIALMALAIATALPAAVSAVEAEVGARLGTAVEEIAAGLGADGYDMTRFEREDGRIEVTAIKGNRRIELYVDPATGLVTGLEERARRGAGPRLGMTDDEIRRRLAQDGYEIVKYERERGRIEVYALKDGRRWELKLDPHSGRVLRAEQEG